MSDAAVMRARRAYVCGEMSSLDYLRIRYRCGEVGDKQLKDAAMLGHVNAQILTGLATYNFRHRTWADKVVNMSLGLQVPAAVMVLGARYEATEHRRCRVEGCASCAQIDAALVVLSHFVSLPSQRRQQAVFNLMWGIDTPLWLRYARDLCLTPISPESAGYILWNGSRDITKKLLTRAAKKVAYGLLEEKTWEEVMA